MQWYCRKIRSMRCNNFNINRSTPRAHLFVLDIPAWNKLTLYCEVITMIYILLSSIVENISKQLLDNSISDFQDLPIFLNQIHSSRNSLLKITLKNLERSNQRRTSEPILSGIGITEKDHTLWRALFLPFICFQKIHRSVSSKLTDRIFISDFCQNV